MTNQKHIGDQEVEEMLRKLQGPPNPISRRSEGRSVRRGRAGGVGIALIAVITFVAAFSVNHSSGPQFAAVEDSPAQGSVDRSVSASCGDSIVFRDQRYLATTTGVVFQAAGTELGTVPQCGVEPQHVVELRRIDGVAPDLALLGAGAPPVVYIAGGRCVGFSSSRDIDRCLHRLLRVGGRAYAESRLDGLKAAGTGVGSGRLDPWDGESAKKVVLESLETQSNEPVPPRLAVGVAGIKYVALDACRDGLARLPPLADPLTCPADPLHP